MIAAVAGAGCIGLSVFWLASRRPRPPRPDLAEFGMPVAARESTPLARRAEAALARTGWARNFSRDLSRAGFRLGAGEYVVVTVVGSFAIAMTLGALAHSAVAGLLVLSVLITSGRLVVRRRARRWCRRFDDELPDALDLLAGSLEAGASLSQAMELVASEGRPPLSDELAHALADNKLGAPLPDALDAAAERVGSRDFTWCVRAVRAQQEFGASLAALMRTLAEFMRFRQELRRELDALTAEGRMSAYVLIGLPFVLAGFFLVVNPGYLSVLVTTPLGLMLSVLASGLLAGGAVWMRRIVKMEV